MIIKTKRTEYQPLKIKDIIEDYISKNLFVDGKLCTITSVARRGTDIINAKTYKIIIVNGNETFIISEGNKEKLDTSSDYQNHYYGNMDDDRNIIGTLIYKNEN